MNDNNQSSGGFLSGVMFGALAGVAGFFLMGTDEGKKARKKLAEKWEQAKHDLAQDGVIDDVTKNLPEFMHHTIEHIVMPTKKKATNTIKKSSSEKKVSPKKKKSVKKLA